MTWVNEFENDYWKIESTLYNFIYNYGYRWEKSFIRLTCKSLVDRSELKVNGVQYDFFSDGEQSLIEITDDVRSNDTGSFEFEHIADGLIYTLEYIALNGQQPTSDNLTLLPKFIPFISGNEFWVQVYGKQDYLKSDGTWQAFYGNGGVLNAVDVNSKTGFNLILRGYDGPTPNKDYNVFELLQCSSEYITVEWLGRFGFKKSWCFKIEREISSTSKQLSLQTLDSSYNVLKNKRKAVQVIHRKADHTTQQYLSDLVLSDEVYIYSGTTKSQVDVDTNSFEVTEKKRDIQILINVAAYDTI